MTEAVAAEAREDWRRVVDLLEDLRDRNIETSRTRVMLGTAYLFLNSDSKALDAFEGISKPLRDPEAEALRWISQAFALKRLGRAEEAIELLEARISDRWPALRSTEAREMLRELDDKPPGMGAAEKRVPPNRKCRETLQK
jgi:tetratricopeptide (TPR) repeat protein